MSMAWNVRVSDSSLNSEPFYCHRTTLGKLLTRVTLLYNLVLDKGQ